MAWLNFILKQETKLTFFKYLPSFWGSPLIVFFKLGIVQIDCKWSRRYLIKLIVVKQVFFNWYFARYFFLNFGAWDFFFFLRIKHSISVHQDETGSSLSQHHLTIFFFSQTVETIRIKIYKAIWTVNTLFFSY